MRPGPLIMLIIGIVLTFVGGALTAGGALTGLGNSAQGEDGYFSSPTATLSADSYALVNRSDDPDAGVSNRSGGVDPDLASLRVTAESTTGGDVFIGIAPTEAVDEYLAGVHQTEVRDFQTDPFQVRYVDLPGSGPPGPPAAQDIWTESASGPGEQTITITWQSGDFTLVAMNADASQSVSVDVTAGARIGFLGPVTTALVGVGVITLLIGLLLVILGIVGLARGRTPNPPAPAVAAGSGERPPYPTE
jgi:hypothetical protein